MKRRSFILGASTLALSQLLAGCGGQNRPTLRVRLLKNSVPALLIKKFRQEQKNSVVLEFVLAAQLKDLFANLQEWKQWEQNSPAQSSSGWNLPFFKAEPKNAAIPSLITLGDYWLAPAIQMQLIEPLNITELSGWQQLPPKWQEQVIRNLQGQLDPKGQIWGAPYRWGCTAIAYRIDKFKSLDWQPSDWRDLWNSKLTQRISLPNQPREVIGLTLKKLGYSYNTEQLNQVPQIKEELQRLNQQVLLYSSDAYLEPLILGDTWVAVGSSTDILRVSQNYPEIAAVIPKSGTALWADVWVKPTGTQGDRQLLEKWIDFCWQPSVVPNLSLMTKAASPLLIGKNRDELKLPQELQNNPILFPHTNLLEKCEFIAYLDPEVGQQYQELWTSIRQDKAE